MKKLCPTRWSSRYSSLRAVKNKHGAIIRLLTNIVLLQQEGHEMAAGLLKRVSSLECTSLILAGLQDPSDSCDWPVTL